MDSAGAGGAAAGFEVSVAFLVESGAWAKADNEQAEMTSNNKTFLSMKMFLSIAGGFG